MSSAATMSFVMPGRAEAAFLQFRSRDRGHEVGGHDQLVSANLEDGCNFFTGGGDASAGRSGTTIRVFIWSIRSVSTSSR